MRLISLDVKHGRTLDEARAQLEKLVGEVQSKFGALIQRYEWNADRTDVKMFGTGFEVELLIDAETVHLTGDFPFLTKLLANPIVAGLKSLVTQSFEKKRIP
jgi:Putative polyhydroxyalkanoic acid system protein (PHA_gran_rgn)